MVNNKGTKKETKKKKKEKKKTGKTNLSNKNKVQSEGTNGQQTYKEENNKEKITNNIKKKINLHALMEFKMMTKEKMEDIV